MKAGFIGLGNLGSAIATRLIEQGVSLTLWNRTPEKAQKIDAPSVATPRDLLEENDVIFLCLFDSIAVESVFNREDALVCEKLRGKIIIDLSTNHFDFVEAFHGHCEEMGAHYLESPVLGSVVPAAKGELTVLTSGDEAVYEQIKPYLEKIGRQLFFMGAYGQATKMKLINNLCLGTFMSTLAESLSVAKECGIGAEKAVEILDAGAGASLVLNAKKGKLLSGDFSPHFSNAAIYKDLHCLQDLAYALKRPLFMGSTTKEIYGKMVADGKSDLDFASVLKIFEGKSE